LQHNSTAHFQHVPDKKAAINDQSEQVALRPSQGRAVEDGPIVMNNLYRSCILPSPSFSATPASSGRRIPADCQRNERHFVFTTNVITLTGHTAQPRLREDAATAPL